MINPVRTVPPASPIVSLEDVKKSIKVEHTDDDAYIAGLIAAAVDRLDGNRGVLGRAIINQTWKAQFERFYDPYQCMVANQYYRNIGLSGYYKLRLPVGDLASVTSVKYYDINNTQQTLASSVYGAFSDEIGPYLSLKYGQVWPNHYTREDAIEVTWVAGFGADEFYVPETIKLAIKLMVGTWYAVRQDVVIGARGETLLEMPQGIRHIILSHIKVGT